MSETLQAVMLFWAFAICVAPLFSSSKSVTHNHYGEEEPRRAWPAHSRAGQRLALRQVRVRRARRGG